MDEGIGRPVCSATRIVRRRAVDMETDRPGVPGKRIVVVAQAVPTRIQSGIVTPQRRRTRTEFDRVKVLGHRKARQPGKRGSLTEIHVRQPPAVIGRGGSKLFVDTNLAGKVGDLCEQSFVHQSFRKSGGGCVQSPNRKNRYWV